MASALPVVSVGSGGLTDFLSHNYNSLLCAPEDTEAFTNNLITVMENKNLHSKLSVNAQKSALSRDWNRIFDKLIDDYMNVIGKENMQRILRSA